MKKFLSCLLALTTFIAMFNFPSFVSAASTWSTSPKDFDSDGRIFYNTVHSGDEYSLYTQQHKDFEFFVLANYDEESSTTVDRWFDQTYPVYCVDPLQYDVVKYDAIANAGQNNNCYLQKTDFNEVLNDSNIVGEGPFSLDKQRLIKAVLMCDDTWGAKLCDKDVALHRLAIQEMLWVISLGLFEQSESISTNMYHGDGYTSEEHDGITELHDKHWNAETGTGFAYCSEYEFLIQNRTLNWWNKDKEKCGVDWTWENPLWDEWDVNANPGKIYVSDYGKKYSTSYSDETPFLYCEQTESFWSYYQKLHTKVYKLYQFIEQSEKSGKGFPSFEVQFNKESDTMTYDGTYYITTFTNNNPYADLNDYDWQAAINYEAENKSDSALRDLEYSIDDNKITFKTKNPFNKSVTLSPSFKQDKQIYYDSDGMFMLAPIISGKPEAYGQDMCIILRPELVTGATLQLLINPSGTLAVKKTTNPSGGKIDNIKFNIYKGNSTSSRDFVKSVTTGRDGTISADDLEPGTYTVEEVSASGYSAQKRTQTVDITSGSTTEVVFTNIPDTGSLSLLKKFIYKEEDTNISSTIPRDVLNGVTFNITSVSLLNSSISNSSVNLSFSIGNLLSNGGKTIKVGNNLYTIKATITRSTSGYELKITGLPTGTYNIEEVYTGKAAELLDSKNKLSKTRFTISTDNNTAIGNSGGIINNPLTGSLKLEKHVEFGTVDNVEFTLSGKADLGFDVNINIQMKDATENWLVSVPYFGTVNGTNYYGTASFANTSKGVITISGIPYGTYTLTETQKNTFSATNSTKYSIKINSSNVVDLYTASSGVEDIIENPIERGSIKVIKARPNELNKDLSGFKFKLSGVTKTTIPGQPSMDVVIIGTTNEKGEIEFNDIPAGTYTLEEIDPEDYFYAQPPINDIEVTANSKTTETFNNYLKYGNLQIDKLEETVAGGTRPGENVTFHIDGVSDVGDEVHLTATTDASGKATLNRIPVGTYTITEEKKSGFELMSPDTVTITWDGKYYKDANDKTGVVIESTSVTPLIVYKHTNPLERGKIQVNKKFVYNGTETTIKDSLVGGITFHIEGTTFSGEKYQADKVLTKIESQYTAIFDDVPYGNYTISEKLTGALSSIFAVADSMPATVDSAITVVKEATNTIKTGNLTFKKTIESGKIDGIKFRLYGISDAGINIDTTVAVVKDENSTTVDNWMGTIDGVKVFGESKNTVINGTVAFNNIPVGSYTIEELNCPSYLTPMESKTIQIQDNLTVGIDNKVITKPDESIVPNPNVRGSLKIVKESDNNKIDGMWFRLSGISDSGVNIVLEASTNAAGIAEFNDVPVGHHYKLEEFKSTDYFIPQEVRENIVITGDTTTPNEQDYYNDSKYGDLIVRKTIEQSVYLEYNSLAGFKFHLYGVSDSGQVVDEVRTTDEQGYATFSHILIAEKNTYTIEEISTPDVFIQPENQTVHVYWDGMNKDGTSIVDNEVYTNRQNTRAEIPYDCTFKNYRKYFQLTVKKIDAETTIPQGDATLEGAKYGIYHNDILLDEYFTDEYGSFTTKAYECDDGYTIKELVAPTGYQLDIDSHVLDIAKPTQDSDYKFDTIYLKPIDYTHTEQVIKDHITLHKIAEMIASMQGYSSSTISNRISNRISNPISNPINNPISNPISMPILQDLNSDHGLLEDGATFQIYLKSSDSYDNALESERDTIVIGVDGNGTSKDLPYGIYTIHQTFAWDGYLFVKDFDVTLNGTAKNAPPVVLINPAFKTRLKVVKLDAESHEVIPLPGAGFQIYRSNEQGDLGELITMTIPYPTPTTIDTFYTDAAGTFITPEELTYGYYIIKEVVAPEGYTINTTTRHFLLDEEFVDEDSLSESFTYIQIEMFDTPQKGSVEITKYGDVFSSVSQDALNIYTPQWSEAPLAGAKYALYAAADIVTPDGTVHHQKGDFITEVTTNNEGKGIINDLYLGKYYFVETRAPYGMIIDETPIPFELTYNSEVVNVAARASQHDERQALGLGITKEMEQNSTFNIGSNDEWKNVVFGLYANEDLVASNGEKIPKDGLIQIANCDENGSVLFDGKQLPFGKYYVKELETDPHYELSTEKFEFEFSYDDSNNQHIETVEVKRTEDNNIIYGIVGGIKIDSETLKPVGESMIGLFNANETVFTEDTAILTSITDSDGKYKFENVPYGEYIIREIYAPEGYVLNEETFQIEITYSDQQTNTTIREDKIKGDITLEKVDVDNTDVKLSDAVFNVWLDVNRNGIVDDIDTLVGTLSEDNCVYSMQNLEYGQYIIKEIVAPTDYILDDTYYKVFIEENGKEYLITNIKDMFGNKHIPEIGTTASVNNDKKVVASDKVTITDTVKYKHLYIGKEYTLVGTLMDKSTNKELLVNGKPITSTVTFTPTTIDGEITVDFVFDATSIKTTDIVVFEDLYEKDYLWTSHADISDEGQTIRVYNVDLHTTATIDDEKEIERTDETTAITVKDLVYYTGLVIGEKYTITGNLIDKSNNEIITTNTVNFVATSVDGYIEIPFTFEVAKLSDISELVVFENIYLDTMELATHADINDTNQTVKVYKPSIHTTATIDDEKEANVVDEVTVIDRVYYENLIVGKTYTLIGTLMNKATNKAFIVNGEPVISSIEFIPTTSNGYADVEFTFDTSNLTGVTELVVFEDLLVNSIKLTTHSDINDTDQTVRVYKPEIHTTASVDNEKETFIRDTITIIDKVHYENLVIGKTYTLNGILMDKLTNTPILINGSVVYSTTTFTPDKSNGDIDVVFTFDTNEINMNTIDLVVFEDLYQDDMLLTSHADITDTDQTVTLYKPEIHTTATVDNEHDANIVKSVTITDVVHYQGLIVGKSYTLHGILMDKQTNTPYKANLNTVESEITFTPQSSEGDIVVDFEFDIDTPSITELVVFETLYVDETELVVHANIEDEGQTVRLYKPEIRTTAKDAEDNDNVIDGTKAEQTIIDTVTYNNLIIGKTYTVSGNLVDKTSGEYVIDDEGNIITSRVTFVATATDGVINVPFTINASKYAGKTLVAFESIMYNDTILAMHADINDQEQTINVSLHLHVNIAKADFDDVSYFLKGAEIAIFNADGSIAKDIYGNDCVGITDENGQVDFIVMYDENNTYYAQETKAPNGYEICNDKFIITPTDDKESLGTDTIKINILDEVIVIPPATGFVSNASIVCLSAAVATTAIVTHRKKNKDKI